MQLERTRVGVVPGASVTVGVSGGTGALSVQSSFAGVDVRYDPAARVLTLVGRTAGSGTVTVTDASGASATLAVLVAPPASVVPSAVNLTLAGTVTRAFAMARIQSAIAQVAQLQPHARVELTQLQIPETLAPGSTLDGFANVRLNGGNAYVDALGTTAVHLQVLTVSPFDPATLLYSDDPEYIRSDGVLFRQTSIVDAMHPVRAYIYHAATSAGARVSLVLQTTGASSQVQVLGESVGPAIDYACVGHKATARYLIDRSTQQSLVATVTADSPFVLPLQDRDMAPQELVNAIEDLRVLSGDPVRAIVVATTGSEDPRTLLAQPELPGDGHGRKGEYALSNVPPLQLKYVAGSDDDPSFTIGLGTTEGAPAFPNLIAGGHPLAGDYGVLRPVMLTLVNPTSTPQNVYLSETAPNGPVTTTMWFAGDPAPTEVAAARDRSTSYLVKQFTLDPGQTRTVNGVYMTDGGSWFPMEFSLGPTPPANPPPNGCTA